MINRNNRVTEIEDLIEEAEKEVAKEILLDVYDVLGKMYDEDDADILYKCLKKLADRFMVEIG